MSGEKGISFVAVAAVDRWDEGGGNRELARTHALAGDELVRDRLQPRGGTLHEDDLHGVVVLKEDVLFADDLGDMRPLDLGEGLEEPGFRLVVEKRDRPGHDAVSVVLIMVGETLMNHLRDRLGAVLEATGYDETIELVKDGGRQRNADALHSGATAGFFSTHFG